MYLQQRRVSFPIWFATFAIFLASSVSLSYAKEEDESTSPVIKVLGEGKTTSQKKRVSINIAPFSTDLTLSPVEADIGELDFDTLSEDLKYTTMSHLEDYIHEQVEDSFIALKKIELTAYLTLIEDQETEKLDDMSSFPIHLRATFGGMLNFRENKSSISTIDTVYKQNGKLNTIDDINEQVIRDLISSAFVGDDDTVDQYILAIRDSDNDLLSTVASVSV
eukprot:1883905-Ditylum_brightwellii.AAC.1